jgi:hypothetical protein
MIIYCKEHLKILNPPPQPVLLRTYEKAVKAEGGSRCHRYSKP